MNKSKSADLENGLYVGRVTDSTVKMLHADEDAVCDMQTDKLFRERDKSREGQAKQSLEEHDRIQKAAAKRRRQMWYLVKDCLCLCGTAVLVALTYRYGLYVAIAGVTGCSVAAVCRVMNYLERGRN